jgi:tripartite-type tricarboxylate transporter receptor subunit TctC
MALILTAAPHAASAQTYPDRPIHVVVNYAPGGSTDALTRIVFNKVSDVLGQTVLVENKPGANGNIGTRYVAQSQPDGYTLSMSGFSGVTNSYLYKDQGYNFFKDFIPVAIIGRSPGVMIVNKDLPIKTPQDAVAYTKDGKLLNFGSGGIGSSPHLNGEIFRLRTGAKLMHVPYRGEAPAVTDLRTGAIQVMFTVLATAKPLIDDGSVRAIAVTSPVRAESMPNLPTLKELDVDMGMYSWLAVFAPAGTPQPIVEKLNAAVRKVVAMPDIRKKLDDFGAETADMSPKELQDYTESESRFWKEAIGRLGITGADAR